MAKTKGDHIRIGNLPSGAYRIFCLNCGKHYTPALPIDIDMFLAVMKTFERKHKTCKPGGTIRTEDEIMQRFDPANRFTQGGDVV